MLKVPQLAVENTYRAIAVLTSGGDAPGMNAAVRAVVRYGIAKGCEVYGIARGYSGLLEGDMHKMDLASVANIIQLGGTILKTDRSESFRQKSARQEAAHQLRRQGIEALVVIGGNGSFAGAHQFEKETQFPTIGVPGTIDNDIPGTDDTIGFDTAINTAIEAIDRIRDTANSFHRLFLIEVMGRNSGFIAIQVGMGGGAETIIVPEHKESFADICRAIDRGVRRSKKSSIIVIAEGPEPGLTHRLAAQLEAQGYGPRVCILGHIQRGGAPSAHDRFLASTLGAAAVAYLLSGTSNAAVGVQDDRVTLTPFAQIIGKQKPLPSELVELARILAT